MGTDPAANDRASETGPRAASSGANFFATLPGILTAAAGLIVAVTGLVTVLHQAGLVGGGAADPAPVPAPLVGPLGGGNAASGNAAGPLADPGPASTPSPSSASPSPQAADLQPFIVGPVSDGFAWARRAPSADGETLVKLPTGTRLLCGPVLPDALTGAERPWRHCPAQGGYVAARLLRAVD